MKNLYKCSLCLSICTSSILDQGFLVDNLSHSYKHCKHDILQPKQTLLQPPDVSCDDHVSFAARWVFLKHASGFSFIRSKENLRNVSPSNIKTPDESAKAVSVELEQIFTSRHVGKLRWRIEHWLRLIDASNHVLCCDLIFPVSYSDFVDFATWRIPLGWICGNRHLFDRLWS